MPKAFSSRKGEVVPSGQWKSVLPGKWKVKGERVSVKEAEVWEGEVEYSSNGKMEWFISYKYYGVDQYSSKVNISESYLDVIAGGSITGTWAVDTSTNIWTEKINNCQIVNTYVGAGANDKFNVCDYFFPIGSTISYGKARNGTSKVEIEEFSQNSILLKGRDFSKDGSIRYEFSRVQ